MAFISLPDALAQLNLKESELRKLVQKKGFQVFMSGQDDQGKKVICFQDEDIHAIANEMGLGSKSGGESAVFDMSVAPVLKGEDLSLDLPVLDIHDDVSIDLGDSGELGDSLPKESLETLEVGDIGIELEEAPMDDLDIELDGPVSSPSDSASLDLDLDISAEDSLHLEFDDNASNNLNVVPQSAGKSDKKFATLDDTLDIKSAGDDLSFEADETLSIEEDATLAFESEPLALPEESFSLDDGETLSGSGTELSLDDASANISLSDSGISEDAVSRSTTEIIDEDSIGIIFAIPALFCFIAVVFNGCILFGLVQDSNLNGGISYGQNFYASIVDFTKNTFHLSH